MEIIQRLLTPNPYSRPQIALTRVAKIANHYVGNPGSSALANRNYFENLKSGTSGKYASSQYIIGLEGEIIQCVPENEVAYCTNQANSYSISIECCHPKADGKFTDATYNSLIWLNADICRRYKLNPIEDIIRHYDVTGKNCPKWYVEHPADWARLRQDVKNYMAEEDEVVTKTKMLFNGEEVEVERILKDDFNYIKVQDLAKLGVKIGYDAASKRVTLEV